jgi:hypothetical protein
MSLVKAKNISTASITTSKPKSLDNGAKLVYVNYKGGRFNVQTPWLKIPWDLSCYDEGPYPKYSCEISFEGMEGNPEVQGFHDKFLEIEEKLIEEGFKNGVSWFKLEKSKCTRDVIASKFGSIVKLSRDKESGEPDGKWPSTMKLKIPYRDGKFGCKLYNKEGDQYMINNGDSDDKIDNVLVKGTRARCIIRCVGLWIAANGYMCQWELDRAELEVPDSAVSHAFLPDSDGEEDEFEPISTGPKMLKDSDEEDSGDEENSGDEGEAEVEVPKTPEPAPEPDKAPAKPKKVMKQKKKVGN